MTHQSPRPSLFSRLQCTGECSGDPRGPIALALPHHQQELFENVMSRVSDRSVGRDMREKVEDGFRELTKEKGVGEGGSLESALRLACTEYSEELLQ